MNLATEIKKKIDIKNYVEIHTSLKKFGSSLKCLCFLPGHNEKTPSFSINEKKQYFYCFGCNRGGDVIRLRALIEGITDEEAIKRFSKELGLKGGVKNETSISLY